MKDSKVDGANVEFSLDANGKWKNKKCFPKETEAVIVKIIYMSDDCVFESEERKRDSSTINDSYNKHRFSDKKDTLTYDGKDTISIGFELKCGTLKMTLNIV